MAAPQLTIYQNGPIAVSGDQLNTFVQSCDTAAQMRTITGVTGISISARGINTVNDGLGGLFFWNSTATGPDDNLNVIVPSGSKQGAWVRQSTQIAPALANIAALRALGGGTQNAPPLVYIMGYYTSGDQGEGYFWYNPADTTSVDNGGTIIVDVSGRRWYRNTGGQPWSILWFGGHRDGATDNLTAWNAMISAAMGFAVGTGIRLVFPPGKYSFSGLAAATFPSGTGYTVGIDGPGATLYWPGAGGGMVFNFSTDAQGLAINGLRLTTAQNGSGTGLSLQYSPSNQGPLIPVDIRNVSILGENMSNNTSFTQNWATDVAVNGVSNVGFDNCTFSGGTGAALSGPGTGSFQYAIVINFDKCNFLANGIGISVGNNVQGLGVYGCNFLNFTQGGILAQNVSGVLSDVRIECNDFAGTAGAAIAFINADANYISIVGNTIIGTVNNTEIWIQNYYDLTITGNHISGATGSTGILIRGSNLGHGSAITGNVIDTCLSGGINLDTSGSGYTAAANCLVQTNVLHGCTIINNGTNNLVANNLLY